MSPEAVNPDPEALASEIADLESRLERLRLQQQGSTQPAADAVPAQEIWTPFLAESQLLLERCEALERTRVEQSEDALSRLTQDPSVLESLLEFLRFPEIRDSLPESYRPALEAHHASLKKDKEALLTQCVGEDATLDAQPGVISCLSSLHGRGDEPEALVLVIPLPFSHWESPLPSNRLTAEVAGRFGVLLGELGRQWGARVVVRELQGLVMGLVQWELSSSESPKPPQVWDLLHGKLLDWNQEGLRLQAAGLQVRLQKIAPAYLPEESR